MKFVIYGNFNVNFTTEFHHAASLESLGHKVVRLQEGIATTDRVLDESKKSDGLIWIHSHGFVNKGTPMSKVLDELKKLQIPTIAYHLDLYMPIPSRWDEYKESDYMNKIQYFFTVDKLMADWLNQNTSTKGFFLPAAVFDKEVIKLPTMPVSYDVVFVGSKSYHPEWPFRAQLIKILRRGYGREFLHVGPDGDTGVVRGLGLNQIYANAKVAVGDSLNPNFNYPYYTSDRLWESIGRGAFTIYPRIKGLEEYFTDKKEVVYYTHGDINDLGTKIEYYIHHPEERESIRAAGFARVKREGTYKHRWKEIIKTVYETNN